MIKSILATLRRRVEQDPLDIQRLAEESSVPQSILYRFANGASLQMKNVQILADYFDMKLVAAKKVQ